MRRQVAVVAVAALALLSGCSAFGGGTPTATPSDTATASPTPVPYPVGYDESGITNATAARAGHLDGLLATANFTLGYNATISEADGTSRVTLLQAVSPGEPRAVTDTFVTANGTRGSASVRRTRFYANGTQFVRVQRGGNTSFGTIDGTLPPAAFAGRQYVDPALTNVSYDSAERFEQGGETFLRLRATDIENPEALFSDRISAENVAGGEVTLVVGPEGVVRSLRYSATVTVDGQTVRYSVSFAVAGIGRTPVERPEWAQRG
jgi:hypothetical protein